MKKQILFTLLAMPLAISNAYAADDSIFEISGFGSAAVTYTNNDKAEFARGNQAAGASTNFETDVDSNLGVQLTAKVNDSVSLVGQAVVRSDAKPHMAADLTWAFAKFKLNDGLDLKVGRVGAPIYMISDYLNVGYANTMLRSPVEMYSQVVFDRLDGVDLSYQKSFGDTSVTTQFAVGKVTRSLNVGAHITGSPLTVLNVVVDHGPMSFRFGRADTKITMDDYAAFNGLSTTLGKVGYANLANELAVKDKRASFTSFGATLDWKNIVMQGEIGKRRTDSYIADTTSWYLMSGYRMGSVLPYVSYASLKQDSPKSSSVIPRVGPLVPLAVGVDTVLSQAEQNTTSVGLRWDFHKSAALKVQFDHVKPNSPYGGTFVNKQSGFSGPVNVLGASVDFVF